MNDFALRRLRRRLLQALATASQGVDLFDLFEFSKQSRERPFRVLRALEELRARGLIHPRKLRLTLAGLAVAAACGALEAPVQSVRFVPRQAPRPSRAA